MQLESEVKESLPLTNLSLKGEGLFTGNLLMTEDKDHVVCQIHSQMTKTHLASSLADCQFHSTKIEQLLKMHYHLAISCPNACVQTMLFGMHTPLLILLLM